VIRLSYSVFVVSLLLGLLLFGARPVQAGPSQRIVVVGGALTEIVFKLNAGERVVGVDTTSQWPSAVQRLPEVGYQRSLSAEGVLSLRPDRVLVTEAAGPQAVLDQIRAAGVALDIIDAEDSIDGLADKVQRVAEIVDKRPAGDALIQQLRRDMRDVERAAADRSERPRVAFLLSAGRGNTLASGRDTAADAAIVLAGGINALSTYAGYKPLNAEALIAAAPDVILTTERTLAQAGGVDQLLRLPGVAQTPAGQRGRIEAMDGLLLLGFGPRTPDALRQLAALLYPVEMAQAEW
jgi:iron complex transport system substrate-binding protein